MEEPLPSKEHWWRYFHLFEALLKQQGARPHWAKSDTVDPAYMATTGLPMADFVQTCARLDPDGRLGVHAEIHGAIEMAAAVIANALYNDNDDDTALCIVVFVLIYFKDR